MIQSISLEGGKAKFNDSLSADNFNDVKNILKKPVDEKSIKDEINDVNNKIKTSDGTYFEFSVHKPTNTIVVKIVDSQTNEVIDEIPPEKILDLVAGLWKIAGLFVDRKV